MIFFSKMFSKPVKICGEQLMRCFSIPEPSSPEDGHESLDWAATAEALDPGYHAANDESLAIVYPYTTKT